MRRCPSAALPTVRHGSETVEFIMKRVTTFNMVGASKRQSICAVTPTAATFNCCSRRVSYYPCL